MGVARTLSAVALWALAGVSSMCHAQRDPVQTPGAGSEARVALVIGNSAYKESPLKNPANDAADMARVLRGLGFVVDQRIDASRADMKTALRAFAQDLREGGVGLFYYAGHGVQSRGRNFLIPVDASIQAEAELEYDSVDANLVLSYMEEARTRVNIVILDACRNNPFARSFRSVSRGLVQMDAGRGTFIAFATAPGSVAADGEGRNGLYTRHLLESLRQSDTDIDKVFRRVTSAVARVTRGEQVPWVSSSLTGDFRFRPAVAVSTAVPPVPSPAAASANFAPAMELAFWDTIKHSQNPADFREYLAQFPNGRFAGLARIRMKAPPPTISTSAVPPAAPPKTNPVTQSSPSGDTAPPPRNRPAPTGARTGTQSAAVAPGPTREPVARQWLGKVSCERYGSYAPSNIYPRVEVDGDAFKVSTGNPDQPGNFEVYGTRRSNGDMRLDGRGTATGGGMSHRPFSVYFSGSFSDGRYEAKGQMGGRGCRIVLSPG